MKIRAVIFDIYNTLLEVSAPPADAAQRWETLWRETFGGPARLTLEQFAAAAEIAIAREHAAARAREVDYPEIYWPATAREIVPELVPLTESATDEFLYRHALFGHTTRLMPGAMPVLRSLAQSDRLLGLASNCQPYTVRELDAALASVGLSRAIFKPDLCFFSFHSGFSKPSPRVFQTLGDRLRTHGISAGEILMVGDSEEKDILPARAQGWQTVQLSAADSNASWNALARLL